MTRSDVPSPSQDFLAELPQVVSHSLSNGDIVRLRPVERLGGRRALPAGWDNVILKYVKKSNPYCFFSCDQNRVKKKNSRKKNTPFFRGTLKCTFPGCSVSATVKIKHENDNEMDIIYCGELRHKGGVHHCRRIKGSQRENIKMALDGSDPSRVHHCLLSNVPPKVYASGNRDGVSTQSVI